MVERGIQFRREHRDAEALEQFRRADQLNPAPRIRAQIALAEQALAQWVEAERDLNQALSANEDPWIADHASALQKALAAIQQHLGSLTIETNVNGAELWVNGLRLGELPMTPARVVAGPVNVEVRSNGYEAVRRAVDVPPGESVKERIELTATPAPSTAAPPATIAPTPAGAAPSTTHQFLAWGTLGAAGAILGGALVAQLVHEQNAARYNDPKLCAPTTTLTLDQVCGTYRGRAETAQTLANVGYVAAGALGIASAVLFFTAPSSRRPSRSAIWIDASPLGASVGVRGELH